MKFLVGDSQENRHATIRSFLNDTQAVIALILAAIDLEWTIRRVIDAMRTTDSDPVSDKRVSGLDAYAKAWSKTIRGETARSLGDIVDDWDGLKSDYQIRNDIVHGRKGTVGAQFAAKRVETILRASKAIANYGKNHGADPFLRLKQRRVLTGPTKRKPSVRS